MFLLIDYLIQKWAAAIFVALVFLFLFCLAAFFHLFFPNIYLRAFRNGAASAFVLAFSIPIAFSLYEILLWKDANIAKARWISGLYALCVIAVLLTAKWRWIKNASQHLTKNPPSPQPERKNRG